MSSTLATMPSAPPLKYVSYLTKIPNCPPRDAQPAERMGYRFVKPPVNDASFVPLALSPGRRVTKARPNCSAYGISMFDSEENARRRFAELVEDNPGLKNRYTNIAEVRLDTTHGTQTIPDKKGHFDLHVSSTAQLETCSTILGRPL